MDDAPDPPGRRPLGPNESEMVIAEAVPAALLAAWNSMPDETVLTKPLRKGDIDEMFNCLAGILSAVTSGQLADVAAHLNPTAANAHLADYREHIQVAYNSYHRFLRGVMSNELGRSE